MKRTLYISSIICLVVLLASSCKKQNAETIYATQDANISKFIENTKLLYPELRVVLNDNVNRIVLKDGEGENLKESGSVSYYYVGYVFNGSMSQASIFATNDEETATAANWILSGEEQFNIMTVSPQESSLVSGLRHGLIGVQSGEECYILFSGKYGFGGKQLGTIPANSALLYHIWVEKVSN